MGIYLKYRSKKKRLPGLIPKCLLDCVGQVVDEFGMGERRSFIRFLCDFARASFITCDDSQHVRHHCLRTENKYLNIAQSEAIGPTASTPDAVNMRFHSSENESAGTESPSRIAGFSG